MRDLDYAQAVEFLSSFYEGTEHNVELRALLNGSGGGRQLFTRDPDDVTSFCRTRDVAGQGVFFAVATRIIGRGTGRREDLAELPAVWVDIDTYKLGISIEEARDALLSCPLPASVITGSGGGVHGYWLLREPLNVRLGDGPDDVKEQADAVLKQLVGVFAGDPVPAQIAAVMRLPGTHNTKTDEVRPVRVLEASWVRHEFDELVEMLDYLRPLLRAPEATGAATATTGNSDPDPYLDFAKRYGVKAPIDVQQRLAAMTYGAINETAIHPTRCSVSSSLVAQGVDDNQIFELLLAATQRAAGLVGQNWNWKREEKIIWEEIRTAKTKYAPAVRQIENRPSAPVIQLRPQQQPDEAPTEAPDVPKLMGYPLNDLGNAMRLILQHRTALRYVVGIGWHVWDERRYKVDPGLIDARRLAHETARAMLVQAYDASARTKEQEKSRETLIKFAIGSGNTSKISGMLEQAEPHLNVAADDLDRDPMLLNCLNGTVDLRTGDLRQHTQPDLLTKLCGAAYDPAAQCPIWEKFILEIFDGDAEVAAFAQRAIGYSLTGLTVEQVVFILHGSGSNGKSVLIETISSVLADYMKNSPAETWISKPNNGPSNDIASLAGARFVPVVETEHDKQLAEALVKQATGGDAMTARFHYKEFFTFIPKFKLWLATNHKPRIRGSDYAIWRRILLLPFNVTFVDADKVMEGQKVKDLDLKNKLAGEFSGILAWMIRGCAAWQDGGLRPPTTVVHATESYQDSQDNVSGFIRDNCHISRGLDCPAGLLYAAYENWCDDNDEEAVSQRTFGKNLDERGYQPGPRTNKARPRKGIDIKQEFREDAEKRQALNKVGKGTTQ